MSFEKDNAKQIEIVRNSCGRDATLEMEVDRDWNNEQLRNALGKGNIREMELYLSKLVSGRVLEIGCGTGKTLVDLHRDYPQLEFYGVDISLDKLFVDHKEGIHFHKSDAHQLDFPDQLFDLIFSVIAFPYLAHKIRAFKEAHRVLVDGGKGFITIDPSYFIPSGNLLIPSSSGESDIYWDRRRKVVKINKLGKGIHFEGIHYRDCVDFPPNDTEHFLWSVQSRYRIVAQNPNH